MLIKSYQKGSPYIGDLFKVDRSIFSDQIKQAYVSTASQHNISGHNGNLNLNNVVKSAIGEWIERSSLFFSKYPKQEKIPALNIITGEVIEVDRDSVFFSEKGKFTDSCGVASHLDSISAIKSSYYEYFERQSLIFSWLTKTEGKIIDYTSISHKGIKKLISSNMKFVDEIHLIDISLHSSINVILALGFGEHYKTIGLNANFDIETAIEGALEEMLQGCASLWSKDYVIDIDSNENMKKTNKHDIYFNNYMNMTPMELKTEYEYLIRSSNRVDMTEYSNKKGDFSIEKISKIAKDLNLQPYCAYITPFYSGLNTKIVKLFSPDGYPHMYPPYFTEEETNKKFNKEIIEFPNAYRIIPFP